MKNIVGNFSTSIKTLASVLVISSMLGGCTTPAANVDAMDKQGRSKHQADHGASEGHRAAFIDEYDTNSDEQVTHIEFNQSRAIKLKAMDTSGNGLVDETEYLDAFATELEKKISAERKDQVLQTEIRFKSIDKNADGKMIWEEYWASGERTFTHFAKSANGIVTLNAKDKEWDAAPATNQGDNQQTAEPKPAQSLVDIQRPSAIKMPSSHSLEGFIAINDLNGDKQVSADEFRQIRRGIFDETDTGKNGWINPEEYTLEFTNRLDRQAKQVRTHQIKQAKVRYQALNTNKDAGISLEEFNISGERIFTGWDLNDDGKVSLVDPLPETKAYSHTKDTVSQKTTAAK